MGMWGDASWKVAFDRADKEVDNLFSRTNQIQRGLYEIESAMQHLRDVLAVDDNRPGSNNSFHDGRRFEQETFDILFED